MKKEKAEEATLGSILNDYPDHKSLNDESGFCEMLSQKDILDLFRKVMEEEEDRVNHQSPTDD
jgi:hypothetical protein